MDMKGFAISNKLETRSNFKTFISVLFTLLKVINYPVNET